MLPESMMTAPKSMKSVLNRLRCHSWVMLHETDGFVRLPHERVIYTSPPRTSISLQPVNPPTGSQRFSRSSSSGRIHLTNQRVVYLPAESTPQFQSFSAPLLNLRDTHVSAPFFGPNIWTAQLQPVPGGGIPHSGVVIQIKLTFKEGGAFDFHTNFERIKERLQHVVEQTQESDGLSSGGARRGASQFGTVNFSSVHLDELPAYEDSGSGTAVAPSSSMGSCVPRFVASGPQAQVHSNPTQPSLSNGTGSPGLPSEPPPGYEEAQQQSVNELGDRLSRNL